MSCKWPQELLDRLMLMLRRSFKVQSWSNERIANYIIEHIWPDYEMHSEESAVLDEAIKRLKNEK